MSWRDRKQDVYLNHGKQTTTTIAPATAPGVWHVTQFTKFVGSQGSQTFEGVFVETEAHDMFDRLVADVTSETVEAPGNGRVEHRIVDGEDDA